MSVNGENVWTTLQQAGLVQGSAPESDKPDSPWYVKLLLAVSGWLATIFLLGFLGAVLGFIIDITITSILFGGIMIGGAFALLRMPKNEFFEHVALAVSFAGQVLVLHDLFDLTQYSITWFILFASQLALAVVMPNFVHRVLCSVLCAYCLFILLASFSVPYMAGSIVMLAAAWLWLHEFSYPKHMRKQQAIGYGLILALIIVKGIALYRFRIIYWYTVNFDMHSWVQPWMGEVLAGAVMLYVVWQILKRLGHCFSDPTTITALIVTVILSVVSMEARGITVGILILILGFAGSNRVLMGLGIASLLFFISSYYYLLEATLLHKSKTLLIMGLVLIGARWLIMRITSTGRQVRHG
jgi:uncharacterized membrane protein